MQTRLSSVVLVLTLPIATVSCAGTNSNTPVGGTTSLPAPAGKVDLERTPTATPEQSRPATSKPSAVSDAQAMQNWATEVNFAIRKNWTLSKELSPENMCNLAATVRVRLLEDGTISETRIAKSSGNANFDEECMSALNLTSRLPPVPLFPAGKALRGIVIVFAGRNLASCGPASR